MTSASLVDAKSDLRAEAGRRRGVLSDSVRRAGAELVAALAGDLLTIGSGTVVSAYYPIRDELDPLPLLAHLAEQGAEICLPVMLFEERKLMFRRWRPGEPLEARQFGVPEPGDAAPRLVPDILFVPMLAFDAAGNRLGYGAGFYDRTLAELRAARAVTALGLAFDEQEVTAVPHDAYDQRLDGVLTPTGLRRMGDG